MRRQVFGLTLACLMAIVLVALGCGRPGPSLPGQTPGATPQPGGPLKLDTTKLFNYDTSDTSRVTGNMLPPWYAGEYNSYQLRMSGGTPPYTWKYKTTSGTAATIQLSGITLVAGVWLKARPKTWALPFIGPGIRRQL